MMERRLGESSSESSPLGANRSRASSSPTRRRNSSRAAAIILAGISSVPISRRKSGIRDKQILSQIPGRRGGITDAKIRLRGSRFPDWAEEKPLTAKDAKKSRKERKKNRQRPSAPDEMDRTPARILGAFA